MPTLANAATTFGVNHELLSDSSVLDTNGQVNARMRQIGPDELDVKVVRSNPISAAAMGKLYDKHGIYCHPITPGGAALTNYVLSLHKPLSQGGGPVKGSCGLEEGGPNEPYFIYKDGKKVVVRGHMTMTSGSYAGQVIGPVVNAVKANPNVRISANALPPGFSAGSGSAKWMQEFVDYYASHPTITQGLAIDKAFFAWNFHPYTTPHGAKGSGGMGDPIPELVHRLQAINDFLIAKGLNNMPIVLNEWGNAVGIGQYNWVADAATQAIYARHHFLVVQDTAAYVNNWKSFIIADFMFEVLDNPDHKNDASEEGTFGAKPVPRGNWTYWSNPPETPVREVWGDLKAAIAWSNAHNCTGYFGPDAVIPDPPTPPDPPPTPPPTTGGVILDPVLGQPDKIHFTVPAGTDHINVYMADGDAYYVPPTDHASTAVVPVPSGQTEVIWEVTRLDVTKAPVWVDGVAKSKTNADIGPWYSNSTGGKRVEVTPAVVPTPPGPPAGLEEMIQDVVFYRIAHGSHQGAEARSAFIKMTKSAIASSTSSNAEVVSYSAAIMAYHDAHNAHDGSKSRTTYIALRDLTKTLAEKYDLPFKVIDGEDDLEH